MKTQKDRNDIRIKSMTDKQTDTEKTILQKDFQTLVTWTKIITFRSGNGENDDL